MRAIRIATFFLAALMSVSCSREPKIAAASAAGGSVQPVAFNGESYSTASGRSAITLISRNELEYTVNDTTFLCTYSEQSGALRVVMTALGTQQVLYFQRVQNGLRSNDGAVYLDQAGLAALRRQEEVERQEREAARQRERIERERLAAIEAERQAQERQRAEEARRKAAEDKLRAEIAVIESTECPKGEGQNLGAGSRTFVVSPKKDCWTPWLYYGGKRSGYDVDGEIRVQLMLHESMFPVLEEIDGPNKVFPRPEKSIPLKVRFKTLGTEPVTVTFFMESW